MTTTKRRERPRPHRRRRGTVSGRTRGRRDQAAELGVRDAPRMDKRELGAAIRARHALMDATPATSTPELYEVLASGVRAAYARGDLEWADAQRQLAQYARINGMV